MLKLLYHLSEFMQFESETHLKNLNLPLMMHKGAALNLFRNVLTISEAIAQQAK